MFRNAGKHDGPKAASSFEASPQYIQIIDAKKAQNLAIIFKALNVTTEEVCDALKDGKSLSLSLCFPMRFMRVLIILF